MKKIFFLWSLIISLFSNAQTLTILHYDTVRTKQLSVEKIVAFQYNELTIYLDYDSLKNYSQLLFRNGYVTAEAMIYRLQKEFSASDTGHLDQKNFTGLSYLPFENFFSSQIEHGACTIRDSNGVIHQTFILVTANRKNDQYYIWYGVLFFLPGHTKWFIEKTLAEH